MVSTLQLTAARVFVRDFPAARRFYGQTRGLPLQADGSAWGGVLATLLDPSGNALQIVEPPRATSPG